MTPTPDSFNDIARAIQLALAPVFLLTGIAGILNVMTGRLARIIDRGRALTEGQTPTLSSDQDTIELELQVLERRRRFTSVAITACIYAALLICLVIATLFIEVMLSAPLKWFIGVLFTVAMMALVIGLASFLREVHLSGKSIKIQISKIKS
jgi:hypothetical protein